MSGDIAEIVRLRQRGLYPATIALLVGESVERVSSLLVSEGLAYRRGKEARANVGMLKVITRRACLRCRKQVLNGECEDYRLCVECRPL